MTLYYFEDGRHSTLKPKSYWYVSHDIIFSTQRMFFTKSFMHGTILFQDKRCSTLNPIYIPLYRTAFYINCMSTLNSTYTMIPYYFQYPYYFQNKSYSTLNPIRLHDTKLNPMYIRGRGMLGRYFPFPHIKL